MTIEKIHFGGDSGGGFGIIWIPDGAPVCILQIAHGMTEHIGRYEKLAEILTAHGVIVAGFALRGHGSNKNEIDRDCGTFGAGGWKASKHDFHLFYKMLNHRFNDMPHYVMGFSLGSFLVRDYLSDYHDKLDGAVIMGTGWQPGFLLSILKCVAKHEIKKYGGDRSITLVDKLTFENYNNKIKNHKTSSDWLCSDEIQLAGYINDPLCRHHISAGLFYQLLDAMKRTGNIKSYKNWNKDMPVLLISGKEDPVGDLGKGVEKVKKDMKKAGIKNVKCCLIPDSRHDLLYEEKSGAADRCREILVKWLCEKYK